MYCFVIISFCKYFRIFFMGKFWSNNLLSDFFLFSEFFKWKRINLFEIIKILHDCTFTFHWSHYSLKYHKFANKLTSKNWQSLKNYMDKYKHETISFHERNTFAYFFFFNSLLFHNMLQSEISTILVFIPSQGVVRIAKLTSIKMRKRKRIEITVTTLKKKRNENEIFLIKRTRPTTRYKKNIWLVVNSTFI